MTGIFTNGNAGKIIKISILFSIATISSKTNKYQWFLFANFSAAIANRVVRSPLIELRKKQLFIILFNESWIHNQTSNLKLFYYFFFAAFFAFLFVAIAALLAWVWMAISVQCSRESIRTATGLLQREKNNSDSA